MLLGCAQNFPEAVWEFLSRTKAMVVSIAQVVSTKVVFAVIMRNIVEAEFNIKKITIILLACPKPWASTKNFSHLPKWYLSALFGCLMVIFDVLKTILD